MAKLLLRFYLSGWIASSLDKLGTGRQTLAMRYSAALRCHPPVLMKAHSE
ncbi:MAG: hypothetical protein Q7R83_01955 [bacterium]|nr:hypothetical protein [bacterium]